MLIKLQALRITHASMCRPLVDQSTACSSLVAIAGWDSKTGKNIMLGVQLCTCYTSGTATRLMNSVPCSSGIILSPCAPPSYLQIRIWGPHGQQRLETCRIALLHSTPTGTEVSTPATIDLCFACHVCASEYFVHATDDLSAHLTWPVARHHPFKDWDQPHQNQAK